MSYTSILALLIVSLAFGGEVRKLGSNDLEWGYGTTTSPAGKVVTKIPYPLAGLGTTADNAVIVDARAYDTIQAAYDNAVANGIPAIVIPAGDYSITSTLNFSNAYGMKISGVSPSGDTGKVTFTWNGADGGTVILMDNIRDSILENIIIAPGTGTIGVGIDMDFTNVGTGKQVSTNNTFRNISIGTSTTGIRVSNTATSNNDLHRFENVRITGTGTNGYLFNQGQTKYNKIDGGVIGGRTYGINVAAGSFTSWGTSFASNTTDVYLGSPTDAITLYSPQSEGAEKFLDDTGLAGNPWAVTVVGGRMDHSGMGSDNVYIKHNKRGPLTFIGVDFADGYNHANWKMKVTSTDNGAVLNAIGCIFPNNSPAETNAVVSVNFIGNNFITTTSASSPLSNSFGPVYSASSGKNYLRGTSGISGTSVDANNLRGSATFDSATTAAVTFATAESNASFYVTLGCNENVAHWVTDKATTGFTINSQAPSTATCDWILIR